MSQALTHIALHVRDRVASEAFYTNFCGMANSSPGANLKSPWLCSPGQEGVFSLVLVPTAQSEHEQPVTDVSRLGFAVESLAALQALYQKSIQQGIVERAYEETASGARANFRVKDPDGFLVEFWFAENPPLSRKFNNLSLHVRDMNVSRDFYSDWCGMGLQSYGQLSKSCRVVSPGQSDPFQIVFCDGSPHAAVRKERDVSHIGFAVETKEELQKIYERAQADNIVTVPWRAMPFPAGTLFFIRDPDNRNVEFSWGQGIVPAVNPTP